MDAIAPRSIGEIVADLSRPIESRHLKTRKQGGASLTYIEWHTAVKYLDLFAPGWSYHVKSVHQVGGLIAVIASISIPCLEGVVTREATGCEDEEMKGYGDPCSNAEAMALKRAASKFGLSLYLYDKDNKPAPGVQREQGETEAEKRVRLAKEKAGMQKAAPKDQYEAVVANTGPSKDLMRNPKYSPETGAKLGKACQRLVAHGVNGEELLREVNFALTSFGKDAVQSRYELDDESASMIADSFAQWADSLDLKAKAAA